MLRSSATLFLGLFFALLLSACNGSKGSSVRASGISKDSLPLPAAIISNSQLGPQDEPPVVLSSSGEYQLADNSGDSLPVVQYEGISD
jgi:hypothetical protein